MSLTKRQRYEKRLVELQQKRYGFEPAWRDIGEQLIPYRVRLDRQHTKGEIRDRHIYNSRPRLALRTLAAMMMAGVTSPARRWATMATNDPELNKYKPVRQYLDAAMDAVFAALQVSNFYKAVSSGAYLDLPSVATACMTLEEPEPGSIRFMDHLIGEYYLDVDAQGRVDTYASIHFFTSRQLIGKFGTDRVSPQARNAYDRGDYSTEFEVVHMIQPAEDGEYKQGALGPAGMRYKSCWWERAANGHEFLRESGFYEFPVMAPRWSSLRDTPYGFGPGWDVRADCRMLQKLEKQKLIMVDKIVDPPLKERGGVKAASLLPGAVSSIPMGQDHILEPLMTILPGAMGEIREQIAATEAIISETLYNHLSTLFMRDDRAQPRTATEVEAMRSEMALQMGPLLESINDEFLEPVVERTYAILARNGMLPEPPEELEGQQVKVEFISIMHQMQQNTGLLPIQILVQELAVIAQLRPDVLDNFEFDELARELHRITGVRADSILDKMDVDEIRARRHQMEQAQRQGQAMLAMAQGANQLGGADPQNLQQNMSQLAGAFGPIAAAQGGAAA